MTGVLVRRIGESWHEPAKTGYTNEVHLQKILAEHPSLIPGVAEDAQICIEFQSGVGPADVVAVDLENGLTLVECKLASNREIRREIIGQVLDYASRFWRMSVEDFDAQWKSRTSTSLFADVEKSADLRARLEESLSKGEFRIILAVDEINDDLKRIVEYLNNITVTSVAVIAVVYSRSEDQGVEILIPNTYGAELVRAKIQGSDMAKREWTPEEYLEWVDEKDSGASQPARVLIDELTRKGFYVGRGGSRTSPSLNVGVKVWGDGQRWPISMYTYARGACVEFRFEDFKSTPEIAEKYLAAVESVPTVTLDGQGIRELGYAKRPSLVLSELSDETVRALVKAISYALTQPR